MYKTFKLKKNIVFFFSLIFIFGIIFSSITSATETTGIKLPIIMYHSILKQPSKSGKFVITPSVLESDLKYLKQKGYNSVFISDVVNYIKENKPLPKNPIVITFDDGYLNTLEYALPILQKYNMKVTISVVGSFTQKYSEIDDKNPNYAHLTWTDIKEMNQSGIVEFGNHTFDMHNKDKRNGTKKKLGETMSQYEKALNDDILKMQSVMLEKTGVEPKIFTYPFGQISKEALPILKKMGFSAILTCREKVNILTKDKEKLYCLFRFNRPAGISTEEFMKKLGI